MEEQLLNKLYDMGVLNSSAKLSDVENKLTVSAFCRRRLAVFMCMAKMAETVSAVSSPSMPFCSSNSRCNFTRQQNSSNKATSESAQTP